MAKAFPPERSMFHVYKASNLKCPNYAMGCVFCEFCDFCTGLRDLYRYMNSNYPELIERFKIMLKEEGDNHGKES